MARSFARRLFTLLLTALCACSLFALPALADPYTIDEALQLVGTEEGRANGGKLELTDDFSRFDIYNESYFTSEGGKTIILWREAPLKSYTGSATDFDYEFNGEDIGEAKVYLCAELMERIPEDKRAATFAEADNILMAEVRYDHVATMWTANESAEDEMPSEDELNAILSGEAADAADVNLADTDEEAAYIYHPLFDCTILTGLYNAHDAGASFIDWMDYPYAEMRANPAADDYWQEMILLINLLTASGIEDADERFNTLTAHLYYSYTEASYLTEAEWDELIELTYGDDMDALAEYCWNKFWEMAPLLAELDPDCADLYAEAVASQSLEGLTYIVNTRDFSGVDMEDTEIIVSKAYIGQPDLEVLDRMLDEAISLLDLYNWDMAEVSSEINAY